MASSTSGGFVRLCVGNLGYDLGKVYDEGCPACQAYGVLIWDLTSQM